MSREDRRELFDRWATNYDRFVATDDDHPFPFAGREEVLAEIVRRVEVEPGQTALDIGIGPGSLAVLLAERGAVIWGLDFSSGMLAQARLRLPQAQLLQADLRQGLPPELDRRFDCIVSGYTFHEFPMDEKASLLRRLSTDHLAPGGRFVIGDIAFPTRDLHDQASLRWKDQWDSEEFYWIAEETAIAFQKVGLTSEFTQISLCAGVFQIASI